MSAHSSNWRQKLCTLYIRDLKGWGPWATLRGLDSYAQSHLTYRFKPTSKCIHVYTFLICMHDSADQMSCLVIALPRMRVSWVQMQPIEKWRLQTSCVVLLCLISLKHLLGIHVHVHVPLHTTPASSKWEQKWLPTPPWGQSIRFASSPLHRIFDTRIRPVPWPKSEYMIGMESGHR